MAFLNRASIRPCAAGPPPTSLASPELSERQPQGPSVVPQRCGATVAQSHPSWAPIYSHHLSSDAASLGRGFKRPFFMLTKITFLSFQALISESNECNDYHLLPPRDPTFCIQEKKNNNQTKQTPNRKITAASDTRMT